jgi:hypothetical protein
VFDRKKVSRERVIGISFIDILIQTVFVLMLAYVVGFVDPVQKLQLKEFYEAGKDLCKKRNIDSPIACREFLQQAEIVEKGGEQFKEVGFEVCNRIGIKDPKKCKDKLSEIIGTNNLRPCLNKFSSRVSVPPSVSWTIIGPGDIVFNGFSKDYIDYIKNDSIRSALSKKLQDRKGHHFSPSQVIENFDFMRDETCFHQFTYDRPGAFSDSQIAEELRAIRSLKNLK